MVERLFLAVQRVCLQFVIVVFPDHTHLLFMHIHSFALVRFFHPLPEATKDMNSIEFFTNYLNSNVSPP